MFACTTLYEGINMDNNHSLPDLLFSSETACHYKVQWTAVFLQNSALAVPREKL